MKSHHYFHLIYLSWNGPIDLVPAGGPAAMAGETPELLQGMAAGSQFAGSNLQEPSTNIGRFLLILGFHLLRDGRQRKWWGYV